MLIKNQYLRITIWSIVCFTTAISIFCIFYFDLNKLRGLIETNLRDQLQCKTTLGDLEWDMNGFQVGFSTSKIILHDKEENLILSTGPTRLVWDIRKILLGNYVHFQRIESTNFFLNLIKEGAHTSSLNILNIFPPGPTPKIDNLELSNGIISFKDTSTAQTKSILYKSINLNWLKNKDSKKRTVNGALKIGSHKTTSFLKLKGYYTEDKEFDWNSDEVNLYLLAKKIRLSDFEPYIANLKEVKGLSGDYNGIIHLIKEPTDKAIRISSRSRTKGMKVHLKVDSIEETISIPRTGLSLDGYIDNVNLTIKELRSGLGELKYITTGQILNYVAKPIVNLNFKTNKFNYKEIRELIPFSLLPPSTRERIEPIHDDGNIELDLNIKGNPNTPNYFGTILLNDFNLSPEAGFLQFIKGLNSKLTLNNELLTIDYLNIPLEKSNLQITGTINNKTLENDIKVAASEIEINSLQNIASELDPNIANLSSEIKSYGKLDLDLDIFSELNEAPIIKGMINFHDAGFEVNKDEELKIKDLYGEISLNGSDISFDKLNGVINKEPFYVDGKTSLQADEAINIHLASKKLNILNDIAKLLKISNPNLPLVDSVTGNISDLDLRVNGTISKPLLDGMVLFKDIGLYLPENNLTISNLNSDVYLDEEHLGFNNLGITLNEKNIFEGNLKIENYISMTPTISGKIDSDLNVNSLVESFAPDLLNTIESNGVLTTAVSFSLTNPIAMVDFSTVCKEMTSFEIKPHIKKPINKDYSLSGNLDFDFNNHSLKLNRLNIGSEFLSLTTIGLINKINTKDPYANLSFQTDMHTKIYMILKPFTDLRKVRIFGDVDLNGSFIGSPSMFDFTSHLALNMAMIEPSNKKDKRIVINDGTIDIDFSNKTGELKSKLNGIDLESFHAKDLILTLDYKDPSFYLNDFTVHLDPGYIHLDGYYDYTTGITKVSSNGYDINLSELGEFILLNPKTLQGSTSFKSDFSTIGVNNYELAKNANGFLNFNVEKGHIGEISILHKGLQAASIIKQGIFGLNIRNFFSLFFKSQTGDFNHIDGKLKAKDGQVKIKNVHFRSDNLFVNVYGYIDLLEHFINSKIYGYLPIAKPSKAENTVKEDQKNDSLKGKVADKVHKAEDTVAKGIHKITDGVKKVEDKALENIPEKLKKRRFVIPFISSTPPRHFKIEIKGDTKKPEKISRKALRSFKWVRGKKLHKELHFYPKEEKVSTPKP